jgi:pimeloyl-ACP methyl ester carboxylesterase
MKLIYTFIVACCMSICNFAQVFNTGTITVTFNDPSRTGGFGSGGGPGRQIQSEVYYPATTAGSNVAVANGIFPIVVFGHGFVMDWNSYDNVYSQLSKRGYIVVLPRTEGNTSPNHNDFGLDLALVSQKMLALNTTNTLAPIFVGKVLQKAAIGGHSMGGGSSFLAAKNNTNIACLFNFAAAETNPKSSSAAKQVAVPTLIIGGELDCVASPASHQDKMYDSCVSNKKFEIILKKITHCDFGNGTNSNCLLGQNLSFCGSQTTNSVALARYMKYVNPFLDHLLKNNCNAGNVFMDSLNLSPLTFAKKITGTLACSTTGINEINIGNTKLYPNPANGDVLFIQSEQTIESIEVLDILGRQQLKEKATSEKQNVEISSLAKGIYLVNITIGDQVIQHKLIRE